MSYFSIVDAVGTGATQLVSTPPYVSKTHIKVTVGGTPTTAFSWINSGTISLTAPIGASIRVYRDTSLSTRLVSYGDGTVLPGALLDTDSLQAFYLAQEASDRYTAISADVLNASFVPEGIGAVPRPTKSKLLETISVEDFGAVGDGVVDDAPAIQAAINHASTLIASAATAASSGVAIYVPGRGKAYRLGSTVHITRHGISFTSDAGRGACFVGDTLLFDVGDYTDATRVRDVTFDGVYFASSNTANVTAAVKLYRTTATEIRNCVFANFAIHIDGYRASTVDIDGCWHLNSQRTVNGTAFIRLQGTAESLTTGEPYTPGGGIHITNMEAQGARFVSGVEQNYTEAGVLVHAADGLYGTQLHMTGCAKSIEVRPLATEANRVVRDLFFTQCYWDEPAATAPTGVARNVFLGGDVSPTVALASGGTTASVYEDIRFVSCYARGANNVQRCVEIKIGDAGGAYFASGARIRDFQFIGGNYRQATITAIQAHGPGSGAYYPIYGLSVGGLYFVDNNQSAAAGVGSAIQANVASVSVFNCTCGPDAGATDYIFSFTLIASSPATILSCIGNNFGSSSPAIRDINYTVAAGVKVNITDNIPSGGPSQHIDQVYTLATSDASTVPIWTYGVPAAGTSGSVTVDVMGSNADGSKVVVYQFYVGYRRTGATTTLSTGTSSWTTVRAWNPDAMATIPTATLSGNSLVISVTGIAATAMSWTAHVRLQQCR